MILSMVCRDIEHGALVSCNGFMDLYRMNHGVGETFKLCSCNSYLWYAYNN